MGSERSWPESCVIIGLLNSVKNIMLYPKHICDNSYELKLEPKILQKIYLQVLHMNNRITLDSSAYFSLVEITIEILI